ncbi:MULTISPECIES: DedA family protein [Acinetobacter]|jgi:membrane-associated protein|uniref:DedA family protein n=1 Tax=Acinetobacter pollinis TaxID=2605270 RepID=A0ABU6DSM1_9GAMM|nr:MULTISPECIES: DedA family protein [Acinetobacter]MBF7691343.1 DedA family protein [Acinetobacter pollinis]MBF7694086.1 DedA family protein [Acinetobacter pollinis]MBF7699028.1 DedA family protein [Acinetobacter pollinis]MBF7699903.1 DedA family protein [Acinetobacter pollinis]MEB5476844.1 DedA family protein [Acinetobacter pollinis]
MDIISFILHIDQHLLDFIHQYGRWIYAILFLIIFVETGLVIMPFLPGDSLLLAAGALAASTGVMEPIPLIVLLSIAAILGDTVNYHVGKYIGPRVFEMDSKLIKKEHLLKTHEFFQKHGGKTIIFARFLPFFRTFAPFIAGAGDMNYKQFLFFNVVGALLWISSLVTLGYLFGNIPFIKDNFSHVILGIIILSILPAVFEYFRNKRKSSQ